MEQTTVEITNEILDIDEYNLDLQLQERKENNPKEPQKDEYQEFLDSLDDDDSVF